MPDMFVESAWPGLIMWVTLYISDYAFTISGARLYKAQDNIVYEGSYEITPYFQSDINALRVISPKFLIALCLTSVFLWFIWHQFAQQWDWPEYYVFILGAMVLVELVVHLRHLRNYFLFSRCVGDYGISGQIVYPRKTMLKLSAIDLAVSAVFLAILFFVTESWFILGGVTSCAITAFKHYLLARKHVRLNEAAA